MPVHNSEIARIFEEMADLLELESANAFRVRAYRNAARTIRNHGLSLADMVEDGADLTELSGIGDTLAEKIVQIVRSGELRQLDEMHQRTPAALVEMMRIPGLGPKRVRTLYEELGVESLEALEEAAKQGWVQDVHGFGPKTEERILREVGRLTSQEQRTRLDVAEEMVVSLVDWLRERAGIGRVDVAGSFRRRRETVGDIDILAISSASEKVMKAFTGYEDVAETVSQGPTRATVLLRSGLQVDLRVVPKENYGAALMYFTGSKAHNIALRKIAIDRGWKLNEYGIYEGDEPLVGASEEEMYAQLDLPYIVPELREDRGEIKAARKGQLPELISVENIRGDLQMHTTASDGRATLKEMARAAQAKGYEYIAITDHASVIGVTHGLDAERLREQFVAIDALNEALDGLRVLKSCEVDILPDGTLYLPEAILVDLDICVAAVHSSFELSEEEQTERIVRALSNPHVDILAHPTGRLIREREPYAVDMRRVIEAARDNGCFLEINADPSRLLLSHHQGSISVPSLLPPLTSKHSAFAPKLIWHSNTLRQIHQIATVMRSGEKRP